jgi:ferredoxin
VVAGVPGTRACANQNSSRAAFRERLLHHAGRLPGLRLCNLHDRPADGDVAGVDFDVAGRMAGDRIDQELVRRRARVYMCGPAPMMDAVRQNLVTRGMPAFDIFHEVFQSPAPAAVTEGASFQVTFAKSGRRPATWSPRDGPLLAFAQTLGLDLPSGCRVGQCESCAMRVVSGRVRHLNGVEPEEEGQCLACQAVPCEDVVLDA